MDKGKHYSVRFRVWVEEENGHFLGIGRVRLLEQIEKTGSITNAAKEMKMSYRQAWAAVEDMNRQAERPLVEKILGGKGGGGAILTQAGRMAIDSFYVLEKTVGNFVTTGILKFEF